MHEKTMVVISQKQVFAPPRRYGRREMIVALTGLFLFLCIFSLTTKPMSNNGQSISLFSKIKFDKSKASVNIELDNVYLGDSFEEKLSHVSEKNRLKVLTEELVERMNAERNAQDHIKDSLAKCPTIDLERYKTSRILDKSYNKQPLSIAINLRNNEEILPSLSVALLTTIHHLSSTHEIHISIFENNSEDRTRIFLGHLGSALLAMDVSTLVIRSSDLLRDKDKHRIVTLASIRNEALRPLIPYAGDGTLLFINDVVTCAFDIIELVHQLHLQDAHKVVSTDWTIEYPNENQPEAQLYDKWVMRSLSGKFPYITTENELWDRPEGLDWTSATFATADKYSYQRWLDGRPFPIYSGWNGMVAMRANLFTEYQIRFRAGGPAGWKGGSQTGVLGEWGKLVSTPGYLNSDCAASECKLIARDMWNLLDGKARIVLASQSRTTYNIGDWEKLQTTNVTVPVVLRREFDDSPDELIDWSLVEMPERVACYSSINPDGINNELPLSEVLKWLRPKFDAYKAII